MSEQPSKTEKTPSSRNPFGVTDVPDPDDAAVREFAAVASLHGGPRDDNADRWNGGLHQSTDDGIEGNWSSRWRGGVDPTIKGDTRDAWKSGSGEVRTTKDSVFLAFDWSDGARKGLIEAKPVGADRLVGKYVNLTDRSIVRPWVGLIVGTDRIDGRFPEGRLDFRR